MAVKTINELRQYFMTGKKPVQQQFWDQLDSFFHKQDGIAIANIAGLVEILAGKVDAAQLDNYAAQRDTIFYRVSVGDLPALTRDACRLVIVKNKGVFAALQTADLPDGINTFSSATPGWLWEAVLIPGEGGGGGVTGGYDIEDITVNADLNYTIPANRFLTKFLIKNGGETLRVGETPGGDELMSDRVMIPGRWYAVTCDMDAGNIYITGMTTETKIKFLNIVTT